MSKKRVDRAWNEYHFETWAGADEPMSEAEARSYGQNKTVDTPAMRAHREQSYNPPVEESDLDDA